MTRHERLLDDLHRIIEAVEAIDMDDPPRGRSAARALNRLELARSDLGHDLAFFIDWLQLNAVKAAP